MHMEKGFTFTEILVSLLLVTTTTLAMQQQMWQTNLLFTQRQAHLFQALQLNLTAGNAQ